MDNFDIDTPDIPLPQEQEKPEVKDEFEGGAFKLAIIGSGQGGGRMAESFWQRGYRRVCAINTAEQDLATLPIPNKLAIGSGGAGKNPVAARSAFLEKKEDVLDFMRRSFGPVFDRVIITIGAGGGTGAGTVIPLVETAQELQQALKCSSDKVGVIVALPKISEGKKPNANAWKVLNDLLDKVDQKVVSPLIVIDNERISRIFPGLTVNPFWNTANASISSLLHLFNTISSARSSFTAFDANDFKTILDSGLIVFGATPVTKWADATDISHAIRDNLKKNILSAGINLSTGTVAGAVIIGGSGILDTVPQEHLDHGFEQLTRLLRSGSTVHRGIYSGSKETLVVYTAIGGLDRPVEKVKELQLLGDVLVNHKPGVGLVEGEHQPV